MGEGEEGAAVGRGVGRHRGSRVPPPATTTRRERQGRREGGKDGGKERLRLTILSALKSLSRLSFFEAVLVVVLRGGEGVFSLCFFLIVVVFYLLCFFGLV